MTKGTCNACSLQSYACPGSVFSAGQASAVKHRGASLCARPAKHAKLRRRAPVLTLSTPRAAASTTEASQPRVPRVSTSGGGSGWPNAGRARRAWRTAPACSEGYQTLEPAGERSLAAGAARGGASQRPAVLGRSSTSRNGRPRTARDSSHIQLSCGEVGVWSSTR